MKQIQISDLKLLPNNPRKISETEKEKLKQSLIQNPFMMEYEPFIVDKNNIVLSGNQRLKILIELGYEQIPESWVKRGDSLEDGEDRTLVILKNRHNGTDDFEIMQQWLDTPNVDMSFAEKALEDFYDNEETEPDDIPEKEDNTKGTPKDWFVTVNCDSKEQAEELVKEIKSRNIIAYAHN